MIDYLSNIVLNVILKKNSEKIIKLCYFFLNYTIHYVLLCIMNYSLIHINKLWSHSYLQTLTI